MSYVVVITGIFISQLNPSHAQRAKLELMDFATKTDCEQALDSTVKAVQDNLGRNITIKSSKCVEVN